MPAAGVTEWRPPAEEHDVPRTSWPALGEPRAAGASATQPLAAEFSVTEPRAAESSATEPRAADTPGGRTRASRRPASRARPTGRHRYPWQTCLSRLRARPSAPLSRPGRPSRRPSGTRTGSFWCGCWWSSSWPRSSAASWYCCSGKGARPTLPAPLPASADRRGHVGLGADGGAAWRHRWNIGVVAVAARAGEGGLRWPAVRMGPAGAGRSGRGAKRTLRRRDAPTRLPGVSPQIRCHCVTRSRGPA